MNLTLFLKKQRHYLYFPTAYWGLFLFSKRKDKEIDPEEKPLLYTEEGVDQEAVFTTDKKVILNIQREPFLLEEVQACIGILRNLQNKANAPARRRHYGLSLFCSILVLGCFGEAGLMLGLIFVFSAMLNDRLLPSLQKKLHELVTQLTADNAMLDPLRERMAALNAKDDYLYKELYQIPFKDFDLTEAWRKGFNENKPNCIWWYKEDGSIDKFENYTDKHLAWCWMRENHIIHPIERCNNLIIEGCELNHYEKELRKQMWENDREIRRLRSELYPLQRAVSDLQAQVDSLNNKIDHPDFQTEPVSLTLFIVFSIAAIALLVGGVYAYRRSSQQYQAARTHNEEVINTIKDPAIATRLINLTSRLNIDLRGMTFQPLLTTLQTKADELFLRRQQLMAFIGGGIASRRDATTHHFANNDSAGDITRKIWSEAFPKPQ